MGTGCLFQFTYCVSETLLFLTLSRIYNFACVMCKQMVGLPFFLCI